MRIWSDSMSQSLFLLKVKSILGVSRTGKQRPLSNQERVVADEMHQVLLCKVSLSDHEPVLLRQADFGYVSEMMSELLGVSVRML